MDYTVLSSFENTGYIDGDSIYGGMREAAQSGEDKVDGISKELAETLRGYALNPLVKAKRLAVGQQATSTPMINTTRLARGEQSTTSEIINEAIINEVIDKAILEEISGISI